MRALSHVLIVLVVIIVCCSSSFGYRRSAVNRSSFLATYAGTPRRYAEEAWADTVSALLTSFPATAEGLVRLCDRIDASKDMYRSNFILRRKRSDRLVTMLRRNQSEYVDVVSFLASRIPRDELPNTQHIPVVTMDAEKLKNEAVSAALTGAVADPQVDDCELPAMQYRDSVIDKYFLRRFRLLVQREIGIFSEVPGIQGLLAEGRSYMLRVRGQQDGAALQHEYVKRVLDGMLPPMLPALFRFGMSGIVPSRDNGDPAWVAAGVEALYKAIPDVFPWKQRLQPGAQLGPWFYAPYLTSVVSPMFLTFLIGPCRPNRRADGQRGGMLVEKCKFLQESNCKGLCLHQCKLPAQQYFQETLGMPLSVTPNFKTQECQWSWGEAPVLHAEDPLFPKGCIRGCGTRQIIREEAKLRASVA